MKNKQLIRITIAFIIATITYKLIWDNYAAIQGSWYGPLVYGGILALIYFLPDMAKRLK